MPGLILRHMLYFYGSMLEVVATVFAPTGPCHLAGGRCGDQCCVICGLIPILNRRVRLRVAARPLHDGAR